LIDNQNQLWFYFWREGLFSYQDGVLTHRVSHYVTPNSNGVFLPYSMAADQDGTIWIGSTDHKKPLLKYVPYSDGFQTIDGSFDLSAGENLFPFESVSDLYVDADNNLWIATELGVYVFDLNAEQGES
jgi:sugar lactone lactonase YvrE